MENGSKMLLRDRALRLWDSAGFTNFVQRLGTKVQSLLDEVFKRPEDILKTFLKDLGSRFKSLCLG